MSKELTPLEAFNEIVYAYGFDKNVEIVSKALKEYEHLLSYGITYNNLVEIISVLVCGYGIKTSDQLINLLKGKEEL